MRQSAHRLTRVSSCGWIKSRFSDSSEILDLVLAATQLGCSDEDTTPYLKVQLCGLVLSDSQGA